MQNFALSVTILVLAAQLGGCAARGEGAAPVSSIVQTAQQAAAANGDPVAARLAVWLRAQEPNGASASEIDGFLHASPDWPGRALLNQRLQQALAIEPDDAIARTLCQAHRPNTTPSLLRCATAELDQRPGAPSAGVLALPGTPLPLDAAALPADIVSAAVAAWVRGIDDAAGEAEFERLFGQLPTSADQWQRFDRLDWRGAIAAARRQIPRLSPSDMPLAATRLALRQGDAGADGLAAALHGTAAHDPAMLLLLARWQRRHDRDDAALTLWHGPALDAEGSAGLPHRAAFWTEREALAREMLGQHRDNDAVFLADDMVQTDPAARLDSDFLVGWIELERLHAAPDAATRFTALTQNSRSVITTSRGFYWLGRALDVQGHGPESHDAYAQAALRPTSFYGQAAIRQLSPGDAGALAAPILQLRDPGWTPDQAIRFAGLELARAATLLVAWNDPHHARDFLRRLDELATSDRDHALGASFADRLGLPDVAVAIARSAGRHGLVLAGSGWPAPYTPPDAPALPAGLALAIMRQESSFDPAIVSPAGAHGLMQLMPSTARAVSGGRADIGTLSDPGTNMALGTAYLAGLLTRFGGVVPYAVAAYNAGPNRLNQWLQQNGALAAGADGPSPAMIDWIELIPFSETRNYVQRVMENQTVYRVRMPSRQPARIAQR